jgi:hypothetical protein
VVFTRIELGYIQHCTTGKSVHTDAYEVKNALCQVETVQMKMSCVRHSSMSPISSISQLQKKFKMWSFSVICSCFVPLIFDLHTYNGATRCNVERFDIGSHQNVGNYFAQRRAGPQLWRHRSLIVLMYHTNATEAMILYIV